MAMKVIRKVVTIAQLTSGYIDRKEEGVVGFGGALDIRPAYQREFIYKPPQQIAVINSILNGMPLSTMYWAVNEDGRYEVLDGQQRIMSICRFVNGSFSINHNFFRDISPDLQARILNYELDIYLCEGDERDKIHWFETINISGERLTKQELRNAIFTGPWVLDAKRFFSSTNCPAVKISEGLLRGSSIRQEILETAINWASDGKIDEYMSIHRHNLDSAALREHFREVINWVKQTFVEPRPKLMQTVDWGALYNQYHTYTFKPIELERRIQELLVDDEVTNQKGIYTYLLTGQERHLNLRSFPTGLKTKLYTQQGGCCAKCGVEAPLSKMDADHIIPWSKGGTTTEDNCQILCTLCNQTKSNK